MANPVLTELEAQVRKTEGVIVSAIALIQGIGGRIDAAVADALANGATEAQLQPLSALSADLKSNTDALASAVDANQPAIPPSPPETPPETPTP